MMVLSRTRRRRRTCDEEYRGNVELADRLGGVLADALKVEDGLGEDRAAADHAPNEAPEGEDRDHRVAQHVPEQHLASVRPLARAVRT